MNAPSWIAVALSGIGLPIAAASRWRRGSLAALLVAGMVFGVVGIVA